MDGAEVITQQELLSNYAYIPDDLEYEQIETGGRLAICYFGGGLFPISIDAANNSWRARYNGLSISLDWANLALPAPVEDGFKTFLKHRLQRNSPLYLETVGSVLRKIAPLADIHAFSFNDIKDIRRLWEHLGPDRKLQSTFREAYKFFANRNLCGAQRDIAQTLQTFKTSRKRRDGKDIRQWHPTRGALTLDEWQVFVEEVRRPLEQIQDTDLGPRYLLARLYLWLGSLTGKRAVQILGMKKNAIRKLRGEWIASIPPAKHQAGSENVLVTIHDSEFIDLLSFFSKLPEIAGQQRRTGSLFVLPGMKKAKMDTGAICELSREWWMTKQVRSPRPDTDMLVVTATRLRHTVGTQMAMNGVPRSVIASVLEHDSESSCQAYIDAVQSDLCRQLNQVDSNMDGIFSKLNEAYFEGEIADRVSSEHAIYLPQGEKSPLLVGACGRDLISEGVCQKHPFVSCYSGCRSFRPWRDGPHDVAKAHIDAEIGRMRAAEIPINFSARHLDSLLRASRGAQAVLDAVSGFSSSRRHDSEGQ